MIPLTWLYAPGDRPDVVTKALGSGADVVIVDLEDAVGPEHKDYARSAMQELLSGPTTTPVHVRINSLESQWAATDLDVMAECPAVQGLRLPKISTADEVDSVVARLSRELDLIPLLESARAIENAAAIAAGPVAGIALGEADLAAELNTGSDAGLAYSRGRVIVAAAAAGLPAPAQSVFTDIRDIEGLQHSCQYGRSLGFFGRAAIHPRQLESIVTAYLPSPQELDRAREVLEAAPGNAGATALPGGRFVDAAVVRQARRTVDIHDRHARRF